jgi:hypothetical protein
MSGLKVTVWVSSMSSTSIRDKLGAVPGGQHHHLIPQEAVLQKRFLIKINLRFESNSLDMFGEVHGHPGVAGSSSWSTAPSGPS